MGALYIKDPKERIHFFFQCWKEMVELYIPKEKYKFCHGNDLWIENLTKKESDILNQFFQRTGPYCIGYYDPTHDQEDYSNRALLLKLVFWDF